MTEQKFKFTIGELAFLHSTLHFMEQQMLIEDAEAGITTSPDVEMVQGIKQKINNIFEYGKQQAEEARIQREQLPSQEKTV